MPTRLSERLSAARWLYFVGRAAEQELFRSALEEPVLPFHVLHIYGPGGVGKTTLLRAFAHTCSQTGVPSLSLDARHIEPSPDSFTCSIQRGLGLSLTEDPFETIAGLGKHFVLLIDTWENIAALDDWLRMEFLPALPDNALVVLAGRYPLSPAWRADPGWQEVVRSIALRNLSPQESRGYLDRRGIPETHQQAVLNFTHGHPLALSLLVDVLAQRQREQRPSDAGEKEVMPKAQGEAFTFVPEETPDVVRTLLNVFLQEAPGPAQRTALEACALVRSTSEALLNALLSMEDTHDLFEWLRGLSFIESSRDGVFPHDLAREALIADLRWRNPEMYAELHRRARGFYLNHLNQAKRVDQQRILWDYIFLHRDNPVIKPFFEWQSFITMVTGPMHTADVPLLVEMVRRHEGDESAGYAQYWIDHQPQNVLVLRDNRQQPAGFLSWVELNQADSGGRQADPGTRTVWEYVQRQGSFRPGERALMLRFWMARDTYQSISPEQSLLFVNLVRFYLTSTMGKGVYTFFATADADFWAPVFAYGDIERTPACDFEADGRKYGIFSRDWRTTSPLAWLDLMAEREMGQMTASHAGAVEGPEQLRKQAPVTSATQQIFDISHEEFGEAVRDALRSYTRPEALRTNPLLRSRLVAAEAAATSPLEQTQRLRQVLQQAAQTFQESPRDEKLYRVLERTYFHPAPSQEAAAELLDLPFSTYRRYLRTAMERVTELLWLQEIEP